MRAAWKQYDLTPTGEFYLIGYGDRFQSRREPARGIHDRIYGSALLLEAEAEEYLIFNADMIEFLADFCDDVRDKIEKQYGIKKDHILISATHNHQSVRDYHRTWPTGKYSAAYEDFLIQTIVHSAEDLRKELTEVRIFTGKTVVEGYYGSRLHAGQPADNEVILVEFRTKERAAAGIINWAVHSTVLSPENALLTAEYAGAVRRELKERLGYEPLIITGAAGDCSTRGYGQGKDFDELERVGRGTARAIAAISPDQELFLNAGESRQITYPVRYDMREQHEDIRRTIEEIKEKPELVPAGISPGFYEKCLKNKLMIETVDIELFSTVLDLGDLILVVVPGELSSRFGKEIKALSKEKCILICGYTNGFMHYMMPKEEYGRSMETIESLYPAGTIEEYVDRIKHAVLPFL